MASVDCGGVACAADANTAGEGSINADGGAGAQRLVLAALIARRAAAGRLPFVFRVGA